MRVIIAPWILFKTHFSVVQIGHWTPKIPALFFIDFMTEQMSCCDFEPIKVYEFICCTCRGPTVWLVSTDSNNLGANFHSSNSLKHAGNENGVTTGCFTLQHLGNPSLAIFMRVNLRTSATLDSSDVDLNFLIFAPTCTVLQSDSSAAS